MKIGGICFFCVKKMWQVIAATLVLVAVFISVLKYSLPYVGSYSDDIQTWVREEYGAEIYIGNISAGWDGIGPAIILENISFLPNESAPLDVVIAQTRIKLDFWKSVKQRQITSDYFVLDGVIATVNGSSLIEQTATESDVPIFDALSELFLSQLTQFRVENSTIKLNTPSGDVQNINIDELTWYNDQLDHQGVGEFQLGDFATNSLSFVLDLHGGKREMLKGQLFVEGSELDISPWLLQFVSDNSAITESDINFRSWVSIENGIIEQAQIRLSENEIKWSRDDVEHALDFGDGQMIWQPVNGGWTLKSNNIRLGSENRDDDKVNFNLSKKADEINVYVSQWTVARATQLLTLLEVDGAVTSSIAEFEPQGRVHDLYLQLNSPTDWRFTSLFDGFSWKNVGDIPGAKNLTGHFGLSGEQGWLKIEGVDGQLYTGDLFKQNLNYETFDVTLSFYKDFAENWHIHGQDIWLHNDEIDLVAEFSLQADKDFAGDIDMALYAELSADDLLNADNYFPPEYMGVETIEYLNEAIQAGALELGQVVWNGKFSGFPFANKQGVFLAHAQVNDVDFYFAPGWPTLAKVDGLLEFRNDSLHILPQKGYFLDLELGGSATAVIDELSTSMYLDLFIDAKPQVAQVAKLFKATPLRDIFDPVFEELTIAGSADAKAQIRIPLVEDDAEFDRILDYKGQVVFAGNDTYINATDMDLKNLTGVLKFDIDKIWMDDLKATWAEQPIEATIVAQQEEDYHLHVKGKGWVDTKPLLTLLNDPFRHYLSGPVTADADIHLYFPEQGVNYTVDILANLDKLTSTIPAPFGKTGLSDEQLESKILFPLEVNIKGDEDSLLATANYDKRVYFNGILPHSQSHFSQAHLIVGKQDIGLAGEGFKISVSLDEAQIMPWYDFVDTIVGGVGDLDAEPILTVPRLISGKVGRLNGFGHRLNGVDFELTEGNGSWDLDLNAKETHSVAHFDRDWEGKGITIKTEYLRLKSNDEDEEKDSSMSDSDKFIAAIPPIDFTCMDCRYGDYDLKRVDIETRTIDSKLVFNKFNITKGKHQFQSTGYWQGDAGNGITAIDGRLVSDDIGLLLNEYELTSAIRDSNAQFDIIANWAGGPQQFNLATLGGEIKWRMGEGHLTEVSDRGSRLLSLLSFDSIVRKLKLDFRDVFSKGFFYNSMKGSMLIENGIAYTDNTEIDGVPGDLNLQGNVNLMTQNLDYEFVFYPKVTSSLPVIIGWMVNPISGIAALALDKMLESTKVIAQVHFTIQGTIEDPVVTETDRKSRDIQIPNAAVRPVVVPQVDDHRADKFQEIPNISAPQTTTDIAIESAADPATDSTTHSVTQDAQKTSQEDEPPTVTNEQHNNDDND